MKESLSLLFSFLGMLVVVLFLLGGICDSFREENGRLKEELAKTKAELLRYKHLESEKVEVSQ